jgi:predicted SAM-dependent methyltransferase
LKFNIGCGERKLPGYIGVDAADRSAADIKAPANCIPVGDECADEVMAIHLIEHLYHWELPATLKEWSRILKFGGRLVIEAPDLMKACQNVVTGRAGAKHPNQLGLWALYGDDRLEDPFMVHHWAYTFDSLAPLVKAQGFKNIIEKETQFHPVGRGIRDFRLEATKG